MDSGVRSILENMPDREDPGEDEPGPGIGSALNQSQDIDHLEVFYIDSDNGWSVVKYDEKDFQIGDAQTVYRQRDAIKRAKKVSKKHGGVPIEVYTKQRSLNRVIEP